MDATPLYDLSPLAWLALLGAAFAALPLSAWAWRQRLAAPLARRRALTLLTLFLTFDLVIFGAFTRLSDSGLGCPDWPGCYGHASPVGAHAAIASAQAAEPAGPVTHGKAWVEMVHRYLASTVGFLIVAVAALGWRQHWRSRRLVSDKRGPEAAHGDAELSPWWPTATLAWVCLQGAFGALTVTMKLYPAVVTLHLLGGLGLLALLAFQAERLRAVPLTLPVGWRRAAAGLAVLAALQMALGGWVSTNYAVLACSDFPACQGAWWPPMDFAGGFTVWRALGAGADGGYLTFAALTAIHFAHRIGAGVVVALLLAVAIGLFASGAPAQRRWAGALLAVAAWQVASGIANVVLGWPLAAALAHTGGAAALVVLLTRLLTQAHPGRPLARATRGADGKASARPVGSGRATATS